MDFSVSEVALWDVKAANTGEHLRVINTWWASMPVTTHWILASCAAVILARDAPGARQGDGKRNGAALRG